MGSLSELNSVNLAEVDSRTKNHYVLLLVLKSKPTRVQVCKITCDARMDCSIRILFLLALWPLR